MGKLFGIDVCEGVYILLMFYVLWELGFDCVWLCVLLNGLVDDDVEVCEVLILLWVLLGMVWVKDVLV